MPLVHVNPSSVFAAASHSFVVRRFSAAPAAAWTSGSGGQCSSVACTSLGESPGCHHERQMFLAANFLAFHSDQRAGTSFKEVQCSADLSRRSSYQYPALSHARAGLQVLQCPTIALEHGCRPELIRKKSDHRHRSSCSTGRLASQVPSTPRVLTGFLGSVRLSRSMILSSVVIFRFN